MIKLNPWVYLKFAGLLALILSAGAFYQLRILPWIAAQFGYVL